MAVARSIRALGAPRIRLRPRINIARWGALVGGGALAVLGLTRRSKAGVALAAGGGLLAYAGSRAATRPGPLVASSTMQVNCSPKEAYSFWRNFENLPLFVRHLESVTVFDNRRSRWIAAGPLGMRIEWDAEIVSEQEGELIAWRSLPGSDVEVDGRVEFRKAPGNRGTFIYAKVIYIPPAGKTGATIAKLLGQDPAFLMRQDLRRLKALMEAGEIPTVEGQPHGPRSEVVGIARVLDPDFAIRGEARIREVVEAKRRTA